MTPLQLFRESTVRPRRWPKHAGMIVAGAGVAMFVAVTLTAWQLSQPYVHGAAESKRYVARAIVLKYAFEAYPDWLAANPGKACPGSLEELDPYMIGKHRRDPWGRPYEQFCYERGPRFRTLIVRSSGPDGVRYTADDVASGP